MAQGRFPYLFTNLNVYNACSRRFGDEQSIRKEATCIATSTVVGSAVITTIECPKIMAQLDTTGAFKAKPPTVLGIAREHGVMRLLRGYDACICREAFFSTALLGSPAISRVVREQVVLPAVAQAEATERSGGSAGLGGALARLLQGKELFATSLLAGMMVGFVTNGPDQLKTRIQHGQFRNLVEAFRWQLAHGGGVRALYGPAAVYRAFYTGHGVLALNFARHKVEAVVDSLVSRASGNHEQASGLTV